MRLALTVVSPAARRRADVLLDADPQTPAGELAAEFARLLDAAAHPLPAADGAHILQFPSVRDRHQRADRHGPGAVGSVLAPSPAAGQAFAAGPAVPALYAEHRLVPAEQPLAESPLRDGCLVSLGDPSGCLPPEPTGLAEIRVVGGPAAGAVHRLNAGQFEIGSSDVAHLRLDDPEVPGSALLAMVDPQGRCQVLAQPGVTATLDGEPLTGLGDWTAGQQVAVGQSLLELAGYEPPDAALHPSQDGAGLEFNRPPRLLPPSRPTRFVLPSPPRRPERRPLPLLMAGAMLLMGIGLAYFLHQIYMLAMCALSPVMLFGNFFSERKHGRKSHAQQMAEYTEHKRRIEQDAAEALAAERAQRLADSPDPAAVLSIATGPRRRLWERRTSDPDYLLLRVGTADLPSAVELQDPTLDEHRRQVLWTVRDAPVTVPLRDRGVLGVAGPADGPRSVARWLVGQAVVLQSPTDLQVCLLTDAAGQASWDWARWLPHCRPATGPVAAIGTDAETVAARIAELGAIITDRQRALREAGPGQVRIAAADVLVVFDGSRRLRALPGAIQILREGPQVGVYSICLDAEERLLPAECHAVAAFAADGLRVQQMSEATIGGVRPDCVSPAWCARLARGIAAIRDISDAGDGLGLPDSSRLLDVLRLEPPTAAAVAARWSLTGQSTLAVVGESYDGAFGIDLRRDGPHGLIAGTTGSGKSELLQTIVASLAVANRPDAMTFVLVDYKGGSAFKDCTNLPHTVGMVTDLDPHLVERALASLSAELTRREHILADAGAKDIEDYADLLLRQAGSRGPVLVRADRDHDGALAPMPRLMIVIDEFAAMARELPDFVAGLVNIAQRGRSLGIHLLLATQRPSGVVSPEIRANTNLRIALRVTDPAESTDVIEVPDAAQIAKSTPGRALVRLGHASLVPFQAARVGGRRPGAVAAASQAPWLATVDWHDIGRPAPERPAERGQEQEITDLKVLVAAIGDANEQLAIGAQHCPWLPALPDALLLETLPHDTLESRAPASDGGKLPAIPYGMDDLPSQQAQRPAAIDLSKFGHMMAAGGPRSGRSQLLRTIAGSAARVLSCADLHIYGIDCGNGALLPLADLPHCGAVVMRTQAERATRLIGRLGQELSRRQELLAQDGYADIGEQRAAAGVTGNSALPHILVLLDRWEAFVTALGEVHNGALTDAITRILGEGASAGVHLVMTGDRTLIAGRISSMTEDKLALRLPDRDDYTHIGLRARDLPEYMPAGRAFRGGSGVETQVALLSADASGQGQADALRVIGQAAAERDAGVPAAARPFRVDVLPTRLSFAQAWEARETAAGHGPLWGLVGVGGDELTAYGPDLSESIPAFVVAGPVKSGRSTVLVAMARSFLAAGTQVILATPRPSPLRALRGADGVVRLFEGGDLPAEELAAALAELTGPGVVLIDDAEVLRDCGAAEELMELIDFGAERRQGLVIGGNSEDICAGFGGWQVDAKRARRGCLLFPQQITDGDLIGVRLRRSQVGEAVRPGRALLNIGDGELLTVAVPAD
jgi:DNA segregation ATPase FtsK/SpoIIIE, S-DNA-T family